MKRSAEAPQQHKQPSRKGKRAWRKNVDVSEVQSGLEQARNEVIKGGIIAEQPSTSLFTLDTTGSPSIQITYNKIAKPLKSDQILAQRSAIPALSSHKRSSNVTDGVLEPKTKKSRNNTVTLEQYSRLRQIAYRNQSVKDVIKTSDAPDYDPWATQPESLDPRFSYLPKPQPIRAPPTLKESPISLAASKKGSVPAIPAPKSGTSYNPVYEEWATLLSIEGQKEVEAEKKRLQEARRDQDHLERVAAVQKEGERDDDEDGVQTEEESAWEGFESEYEGAEWLKRKRPERKTPAERNRIRRRKERERQETIEKAQKGKEKRERQIVDIVREEKKEEAKREEFMKIKSCEAVDEEAEEADGTVLRRRKLGHAFLPEPPLEIVLPDELQDSLRLLKPEGNLLKDRFRNILVRGKMEMRRPIQQPKKKRRSVTEKWAYKDFSLGV